MNNVFLSRESGYSPEGFMPPVEVYMTTDGVYVNVEIPGVTKEEITLTVNNGELVIKGHKRKSSISDRVIRMERLSGFFYRKVKLPEHINLKEDKISANFKLGILSVFIPRG